MSGTYGKNLDWGRHIFTFNDNVVLLADSSQLFWSLVSDVLGRTPPNVNRAYIIADAKVCLVA